jgi:hypothetical protein
MGWEALAILEPDVRTTPACELCGRAVPECFDVWSRQPTNYDQSLIGNLDLSIDERFHLVTLQLHPAPVMPP